MKRFVGAYAVAGTLLIAGCGTSSGADSSASEVTKTVTETTQASPSTQAPPAPVAPVTPTPVMPVAPAPAAQTWPMPNVQGAVLQSAQDTIQALTGGAIFFTASVDATGQGRQQVLDANWKVCAQTPAAGTLIDVSAKISFAAVKLSEQCP